MSIKADSLGRVRTDPLGRVRTDYHLHTSLCHHAVGTMEQYVEAALEQCLTHICFTDHVPLPDNFDPTHRMTFSQLAGYYDEVGELQHRYRDRIRISLGLECDYLPGVEQWLEELLQEPRLDFVLGSLHYLGHFTDPETIFVMRPGNVDRRAMIALYWQQMEQLVHSGLFDAVAHFDVFKISGWKPDSDELTLIRNLMSLMKEKRLALEYNSSGWDKPHVAEPYPGSLLLEMAGELELELVCGSDAHAPDQVGRYRERLFSRLKAAGFKRHHIFELRRPFALEL